MVTATSKRASAPKPERKYHHGALREGLVEAGLDILREKGLEALSLRACAERMGVSHAAPAHHFRTGKAFLTAIATKGFEQLFADLEAANAVPHKDAFALIEAACAAYLRFVLRHHELYKLMFSRDKLDVEDIAIQEASARAYALLTQAATPIERDVTGALGYDLMRTEQLLWAVLQGYAKLYLDGNIDCTLENDEALVVEAQRFATLLRAAGGQKAP